MQSFFLNVTEIGVQLQGLVNNVFNPDASDDDNNDPRVTPHGQLMPAYAMARPPGLPGHAVEPRHSPRLWQPSPPNHNDPVVPTVAQMSAQRPAMATPNPPIATIQPQRIAAALEALTARIEPNPARLAALVKEAHDLGANTRLSPLWHSSVLNEILDHGRSCQNLDEILARFYDRKLDLIAYLSWPNRFRYGSTIKSLADKLIAHKTVLQEISNRYALLTGVTPGQGAVDILSYFFRPDRLQPQAKAILETYAESLNTSAHPPPLRWPHWRLVPRS